MKSHRMGELQPWPAALNKDGGGAEDFINLLFCFPPCVRAGIFGANGFFSSCDPPGMSVCLYEGVCCY